MNPLTLSNNKQKLLNSNLVKYIYPLLKETNRKLLGFGRTPSLSKIEFHLTDHCNLNCKGCSHYSPIASEWYADPQRYEKDIQKLKKIFKNIRKIRLMGGEPLLHAEPESFIRATRTAFPRSLISFVTNGILLPKASGAFWNACRDTGAIVDLTVYPPMINKVNSFVTLCEDNGVCIRLSLSGLFKKRLDLQGSPNKKKAFKFCRKTVYDPQLRNGYIFLCPTVAYVEYFNKKFGPHIPHSKGLNIYDAHVDASKILKYLNTPIAACKWCTYSYTFFPWSISAKECSEWDVGQA